MRVPLCHSKHHPKIYRQKIRKKNNTILNFINVAHCRDTKRLSALKRYLNYEIIKKSHIYKNSITRTISEHISSTFVDNKRELGSDSNSTEYFTNELSVRAHAIRQYQLNLQLTTENTRNVTYPQETRRTNFENEPSSTRTASKACSFNWAKSNISETKLYSNVKHSGLLEHVNNRITNDDSQFKNTDRIPQLSSGQYDYSQCSISNNTSDVVTRYHKAHNSPWIGNGESSPKKHRILRSLMMLLAKYRRCVLGVSWGRQTRQLPRFNTLPLYLFLLLLVLLLPDERSSTGVEARRPSRGPKWW